MREKVIVSEVDLRLLREAAEPLFLSTGINEIVVEVLLHLTLKKDRNAREGSRR